MITWLLQGSVDWSFLFNLFINEIFMFLCFSNLSNYADDNDLFTTGTDIQLINQLLSTFINFYPTLWQQIIGFIKTL